MKGGKEKVIGDKEVDVGRCVRCKRDREAEDCEVKEKKGDMWG